MDNSYLKKIRSRWFSLWEFANKEDGYACELDLALMETSDRLRDIVGPTNISSGYRTPEYNARPEVGGSSNSYHTKGLAADYKFNFTPWTIETLKLLFTGLGYTNVGIYVSKSTGRILWVHGDIGKRWNEVGGWEWFRDSAVKVYYK